MSSLDNTYKVVVAGDEIAAYSLCLRLCDKSIEDPWKAAQESLTKDWPKDEWTKFYTISLNGKISTVELDLELHGPWVWELYNVMDTGDYFRRFDGAVICGNPQRPDSLGVVSSLIESMRSHLSSDIPIVLFVDRSNIKRKADLESFQDIAQKLGIQFGAISIVDDLAVDNLFKELAMNIHTNVGK